MMQEEERQARRAEKLKQERERQEQKEAEERERQLNREAEDKLAPVRECTTQCILLIYKCLHVVYVMVFSVYIGSDYRGQVQASSRQETEVSTASGLIMCESSTSEVFTLYSHVLRGNMTTLTVVVQ